MARYYNPHNYTVTFTGADGGRLSLPPVTPGFDIKTVEGDYYKHLVERGTLAVLTPEVGQKAVEAYRQMMAPKKKTRMRPAPVSRPPQQPDKPMGNINVTPPPAGMSEEEFKKAAEEPLKKDTDPDFVGPPAPPEVVEEDNEALFDRDTLQDMTMKDLYAVIKANEDFGPAPKGAKKKDLIDLILEKQ